MWNKIQRIYVGDHYQVRPKRTPWTNTLAYRPLTSTTTVNDQSGNNRNLTNTGSVTFWTYKGVNCAYFSWSNKLTTTSFVSNQQAVTVSCWVYFIRNGYSNNWNYNQFVRRWGWSSANFWPYYDTSNKKIVCSPWGMWTIYPTTDTVRRHLTVTFNWSNIVKLYVNWVLDGTNSSASVPSWSRFGVWGYTINNTNVRKWWISEVIVENKVRTDQEIANYFNQTKSNYWL